MLLRRDTAMTIDGGDMAATLAAAGFVAVAPSAGLAVDLRYATPGNFLGRPVYGTFDQLWLHPIAATKLAAAVAILGEQAPDRRLLVLDGLRPNRVQRLMWAAVAGTAQQRYVGDPATGSIHGFGLAVDLTIIDADGRECDLGTGFDAFTPLSEPRLEQAHLETGALTTAQVSNRCLLRSVMEQAGFLSMPLEWWHFDALAPSEVRSRFRLFE